MSERGELSSFQLGQPPIAALVLDRDGVINREVGHHVCSWDEFEFLPRVLSAFELLARLPLPLIVASNQSAIGRGWVSAETVDNINSQMVQTVIANGGRIDDVLICPHAPDAGCNCRKPLPGLVLEAAARRVIAPEEILLVGDSLRDLQAAQAAGSHSILVRSGNRMTGETQRWIQTYGIPVVADLYEVAELLTQRFASLKT